MRLTDVVEIQQAITVAAGAAGTSAIEGSVIDMGAAGKEADGVLFVIQVGPVVAGAVTSAKVQQGDASDLSDAADLAGTSISIADSDDNKVKFLQVLRPRERYLRLYVSRATQNATVTAMAFKFKLRKQPGVLASDVTGETHVRPAEGTA